MGVILEPWGHSGARRLYVKLRSRLVPCCGKPRFGGVGLEIGWVFEARRRLRYFFL